MRWILILLLAGLPLQAQEDKSAELAEIIELLQSGDAEERAQAIEKLRDLDGAASATVKGRVVDGNGLPVVTFDFGQGPRSEVMSGSHNINGKRTDYTLRSLGKGRYKLEASVTTAEGEKSDVKDEGTLAELRKKYEFLGDSLAVRLPTGRFFESQRLLGPKADTEISIAGLGLKVKRPGEELSWHFYVPPGVGFVVTKVDPLSLGHKLGLKPHDLLLKIDGRPIESRTELADIAKGRGTLEGIRRAKPIKIDFPADK